jgi:hypothetical protein
VQQPAALFERLALVAQSVVAADGLLSNALLEALARRRETSTPPRWGSVLVRHDAQPFLEPSAMFIRGRGGCWRRGCEHVALLRRRLRERADGGGY